MKVEFTLKEKTFENAEGKSVKYYVLNRTLIDGTQIEIPIKGDKSKLLIMSLTLENKR